MHYILHLLYFNISWSLSHKRDPRQDFNTENEAQKQEFLKLRNGNTCTEWRS